MIKFLRILTQKILLVIIFLCLSFSFSIAYAAEAKTEPLTLEEALKIYSTPFIDDYRARYEASQRDGGIVLMTYNNCSSSLFPISLKIPCTEKDIENIKMLAKYGDGASLELAFNFIDRKLFDDYAKQAADAGIPEGIIWHGGKIGYENLELGENYLENIKAEGYTDAYKILEGLYSHYKMVDKFCAIIDEGYRKFGFEFIARGLLLSKPRPNPTLTEQYPEVCNNKTADEFLDKINSYEAKLVRALRYIRNNNYRKARILFEEIYKKTDNEDLKQNAGFCLGAMYYSGDTVKQNKEYGMKLMKEAVDAGYVTSLNIPELQMMPDKYKMINTYNHFCEIFAQY